MPDVADDDSLPPLDVDKELRKKILSRRKQQRYRKRILADNEVLRDRARELEFELQRLKMETKDVKLIPTILSWQEVARVLMEERDNALKMKCILETKTEMYRNLIINLQTWAQQVFGLPTSPRTDFHTWRNVSLSVEPHMRREGIEWITKHLYHNTDGMFERYDFPQEVPFNDVHVKVTESDGYQCIHRFHVHIGHKMEDIATALRGNIWKFLMVGALSAMDPETLSTNADMNIFRHTVNRGDECVNLLSREFLDYNRCVFVGEQIEDDQALPSDKKRQRRRMLWITLDRMSPVKTMLRILFMNSHSFTKEGYISLDDEAKLWGCDLSGEADMEKKAIKFRQHVLDLTKQFNQMGRSRFNEAIMRTTNSPPTSPPPLL